MTVTDIEIANGTACARHRRASLGQGGDQGNDCKEGRSRSGTTMFLNAVLLKTLNSDESPLEIFERYLKMQRGGLSNNDV